jgi:hypothetical protein
MNRMRLAAELDPRTHALVKSTYACLENVAGGAT